MPTVLRTGPYRFLFYAGDRDELPHVHVEREDSLAKFWLDPIRLQRSRGFNRVELRRIQRLIDDNHTQLLEAWHGYFGR
jgi:hypothetical protein